MNLNTTKCYCGHTDYCDCIFEIRDRKVIHSFMIPIVFDSLQDGKRYIIADGKWTEVEKTFEWNDIIWFQKPFKGGKNEAFKIQMEWEVKGSGGSKYTVRCDNDKWSCSCPAFGWGFGRKDCKHIIAKKDEITWPINKSSNQEDWFKKMQLEDTVHPNMKKLITGI